MNKILFIPFNSREIAQFSFVVPELKKYQFEILSIALDREKQDLLREKDFYFKNIQDYKTFNAFEVLKQEKPDLIIIDFCIPILHSFIIAANHLNIPLLQIDGGVVTDYSELKKTSIFQKAFKIFRGLFRLFFSEAKRRNYLFYLFTFFADKGVSVSSFKTFVLNIIKFTSPLPEYINGLNIAVMGPFGRDAYIKMGVPPEKLFITGQPGFDIIWQRKFDKEYIIENLKIPKDKGIVVLATQPLAGYLWEKKDWENFVRVVIDAMDKFPKKQLVIKLHPDEKIEEYQKLLSKLKYEKAVICQNIDLYELLSASDLLLTVCSTVGLEAMLFDKPVITVNLTGKPDLFPYAESGAALGVYKEKDLVPTIKNALYNQEVGKKLAKARKKFIYEQAYIQDGKASERVANLILHLIGKKINKNSNKKNIEIEQ